MVYNKMFTKWGIICLVIFVKLSEANNRRVNITRDVGNFINSLQTPVKINLVKCWSRGNTIYFLKNSIDSHRMKTMTKIRIPGGPPENHLFILDLTCDHSRDILKQASELKLLDGPYKWLLIGQTDVISDLYFGLDSHIYVMNANNASIIYKLSKKCMSFQHNVFAPKRTNLMGKKLKISIVITNPDSLNHLWDYRDRHIDSIGKVGYILVHHLMDFLNASKDIIIRNTWGYMNQTTGLYSGMVGDLQTGFAELGGTPLFFTIDRTEIVDYIIASAPTYMRFIFKAPPLSYVTNIFTLPFSKSVWHFSFVMIAVVIVSIYVIVCWEWKSSLFRTRILKNSANTLKPNVFDVIMLEIGAITQQGTAVEPKSNSGRIITFFSFATLMFLYTSYSANVVALLQSTTDNIRTLDDLLNSRIKLGVEDIVYSHYYFKGATEPTRKAIYDEKIAPNSQKPNFMNAEQGIRRVRDEFFAFHVEVSTGYKIIGDLFEESEKCGLKEIEYVNLLEPWMAVRKNSMYKEVIKIGMRRLQEHGIQNREVRRIYTRKPQCHSRGSNFGSVGLIDCYSGFLIFGIGVACGSFLFVLELLTNRYLKKLLRAD